MKPPKQLFAFIIFTVVFVHFSHALPFIVLHGLGNACTQDETREFTEHLVAWSGSNGTCLEIGDGEDTSWHWPLHQQVHFACEKIKSMAHLKDGYNLVGLSQGTLIGRGLIMMCDNAPQVKNFISFGGPQAGIVALPHCGVKFFCKSINLLIKGFTYSRIVQSHVAPSGYVKLPNNYKGYLRGCSYLPYINNEIPGKKNETYKKRFSSLVNLIMIMCNEDDVVIPRESSWFGFYPDGAYNNTLPTTETRWYKEDWFGLRTLDEEGRVKFIGVTGGHIEISGEDMQKHMVPYLRSPEDSGPYDFNLTGTDRIFRLHSLD
ncbi:hypothetical protein vseg_016736 [Gypsophila vaccaria]